jgi:UDP-GlcNAc3NAcA epimerase
MRIVTIVGARPQFVKAAALSPALRRSGIDEVLVHTGQHYDYEMSTVFFDGLSLPAPDESLGVGSASHGAQTARMLEGVERVLLDRRPEWVVVYGDTNSTLAGALAAAKLRIPVAHVEAGLRSFDREMPEETNRVLTDHLSSMLFAPTAAAVDNLAAEGIRQGVFRTGDVMLDVARSLGPAIEERLPAVLERFGVAKGAYALATVHRAENTDDPERWAEIVEGLSALSRDGLTVVWPAHPRIGKRLDGLAGDGMRILRPLPYLEAQCLLQAARVVLTDSGGLQKEAAYRGVPCVTLRPRTEWVELVEAGVNVLADARAAAIVACARAARWPEAVDPTSLFDSGSASEEIASLISRARPGSSRGA